MKTIAVFVLIFFTFMAIATLISREERKLAERSCAEYKRVRVQISSPPFHSEWECVRIVKGK